MFSREQIRQAQELAVEVMKKSVNEPDKKIHPKVGAVLLFPDGSMTSAYRGELDYGDHAEFTLLHKKHRTENIEEAWLFGTLEPCMARHPNKTPCAKRIQLRKIKKVYIGIDDPDPTVSGTGKKYLEDFGISIEYFDRDLQNLITQENQSFLEDAILRSETEKHKKLLEEKPNNDYLSHFIDYFEESDISQEALRHFINEANYKFLKVNEKPEYSEDNIYNYFKKWGLVAFERDKKQFSINFILLFGKKPSDYLDNSLFQVRAKTENKSFDLPLVLLPNELFKWYSSRIPTISSRENPARNDQFIFPIDAINEACINAMIHRDYSIQGSFNQMLIEDNQIIINSPGDVVSPQKLDDVSKFTASSIVRNHKLAFIFRSMNLMENNHFGMVRFKDIPRKLKQPFPLFNFKSPILSITFLKSFSDLSDKYRSYFKDDVSDEEISIIKYLSIAQKTTMKEIKEVFSMPNEKASQRVLVSLVDKGYILSKGANKNRTYHKI